MDVARELIEHDDARKAGPRLFQPVAVLSRPHLLVQEGEALGDLGIEGGCSFRTSACAACRTRRLRRTRSATPQVLSFSSTKNPRTEMS
jgi:hypothetical protein